LTTPIHYTKKPLSIPRVQAFGKNEINLGSMYNNHSNYHWFIREQRRQNVTLTGKAVWHFFKHNAKISTDILY